MGYSLLQISEILLKADKTTYRLGTVAYENMFSEDSEDVDFERDIIYIYKKAVEYADDFHVGTTKLDQVVERLANRLVIYNYGQLNPIYSDSVISNPVLPTGSVLNDLNDVTITNVQDNQILRYSSSLGQWINVGPNASIRSSQAFTATLNQTVFVTTSPFNASLLDVYLNGVRLNTSSYSTFGSHTITLYDGCLADDILDVTIYDPEADILDISGYVRNTRTLTINGVTQDLSADRTWNVGTLYTADGTLAGNRIVTVNDKQLVFRSNQSTLQNYTFTIGTPTGVTPSTWPASVVFEGEYLMSTANAEPYNTRVWGRNQSAVGTRAFYVNQVFADITSESTGATSMYNQLYVTRRGSLTDTSTTATGQMRGVWSQIGHIYTASIATPATITTTNQESYFAQNQNLTGNITNAVGYYAQSQTGYTGTPLTTNITNYYGFFQYSIVIDTKSTITNHYGIFLNTPLIATGGTIVNRWGIYAPDIATRHYFNGNVLLGTTSDTGLYKLDVNGAVRVSQKLLTTSAEDDFGGSSDFVRRNNNSLWFYSSTVVQGGIGSATGAQHRSIILSGVYNGYTTDAVYIGTSTTVGTYFQNTYMKLGGVPTLYTETAILELESTTRGFLPTRMTTTDKTSIVSPVAGLIVYDNTLNALNVYNGTSWVSLGAGGGGSGVPYTGATANVDLGEYELKAGQITLDTTPTGTAAVGTTRWNDTFGGSETTLKGGSVVLKNGVDLVARVVNKVTPNATLTKAAYQAVRVSGAQGQRLAVAYAQANNDANSADTIGLVCETIATNQEGFIMAMGQLENINTTGLLQGETWVDGDVLYLSPFTPGAVTKVKPTGAGHIVVIGYVEYAHANNGKIYVKVMNGWELEELHNVDIVSPANNEALIYESSTALWKNKTIATALGYTPISGSGVTGQVAYWNGTNSQTGSNNLFWDAANARLGIGGITASRILDVRGTFRASNASGYGIDLNSIGEFLISTAGGSTGLTISDASNAIFKMSASTYAFRFVLLGASQRLELRDVNQSDAVRLAVSNTGNLSIGLSTDGGQRLQVYGDAFVRGSGATSATNALLVQNSSGVETFLVRNDAAVKIGLGSFGHPSNTRFQVNDISGNTILRLDNATLFTPGIITNNGTSGLTISGNQFLLLQPANTNNGNVIIGGNITNTVAYTNDTRDFVFLNQNWNAVVGTSNIIRNALTLNNTINYTNATGTNIARGLYINPVLTAVSDWRSIEWSNNSGWGLYGAGTANNFLGGNTTIKGTGAISATTLFQVQNSSSVNALTVRGDKAVIAEQLLVSDGGNKGFSVSYAGTGGYQFSLTVNDTSVSFLNNAAVSRPVSFSMNTGEILRIDQNFTSIVTNNFLVGTTVNSTFKLDVNGTARVSDQITSSKTSGSAFTMNANAFFQYSNNDILSATAFNIIGGGTSGFGIRYASAAVFGTGTIGCQYFTTNNATFYAGSISVNLGALVNASAVLQCESTTKGFLPPRMTATQLAAISTPAVGLVAYQTDGTEGLYQYKSTGWTLVAGSGGSTAYSVTSVTTTYSETATSGTKIVKADTTGGAFTVSLPTAVGNTATIIIKKSAGTAALTVDGAGTETIDGGLTATINKVYESITLISDNANWQIV